MIAHCRSIRLVVSHCLQSLTDCETKIVPGRLSWLYSRWLHYEPLSLLTIITAHVTIISLLRSSLAPDAPDLVSAGRNNFPLPRYYISYAGCRFSRTSLTCSSLIYFGPWGKYYRNWVNQCQEKVALCRMWRNLSRLAVSDCHRHQSLALLDVWHYMELWFFLGYFLIRREQRREQRACSSDCKTNQSSWRIYVFFWSALARRRFYMHYVIRHHQHLIIKTLSVL